MVLNALINFFNKIDSKTTFNKSNVMKATFENAAYYIMDNKTVRIFSKLPSAPIIYISV
jgi:hypothetical protein